MFVVVAAVAAVVLVFAVFLVFVVVVVVAAVFVVLKDEGVEVEVPDSSTKLQERIMP